MDEPSPLHRAGPHLLQVPGPTNVPQRVLRAMARPTTDHRGPEFPSLLRDVSDGLRWVAGTTQPVVIWPSSATGASEAALANTLSSGDHVVCCETGHFALAWAEVARRLGLQVTLIPGDWRHAVDDAALAATLRADRDRQIRAVLMVHNETSTGVRSDVPRVRRVLDDLAHPALLLVDIVSSLGSSTYRHDAWGVDVAFAGSQKGLMMPPGLAFNFLSDRALEVSTHARLPRSYWDWLPILEAGATGHTPYTPATNLLYGLPEALTMMQEEGLERVMDRHRRLAGAVRAAAAAWDIELVCQDAEAYSDTVTALMLPEGVSADLLRATALDRYDVAFGVGLGRLKGKAIRIGHLGEVNEATMLGVLGAMELALRQQGAALQSGLPAVIDALSGTTQPA